MEFTYIKNTLLPLCLIFMMMTGCSFTHYQVKTLESPSTDSELVFENEDLRIKYDFRGKGGKLHFTVTNKTSDPLFMDWEHSNFIFNGYSYDYYSGKTTTNLASLGVYQNQSLASVVGNSRGVFGAAASRGQMMQISNQTTTIEKKFVQIPPNSYTQANIVKLDFPTLEMKPNEEWVYEEENTPLSIRTYLAYSKEQDLSGPQYIDNYFWVHKIRQMKEADYKNYALKKNQFHNSRVDDKSLIRSVLIGTGVGFLAILVPVLLLAL